MSTISLSQVSKISNSLSVFSVSLQLFLLSETKQLVKVLSLFFFFSINWNIDQSSFFMKYFVYSQWIKTALYVWCRKSFYFLPGLKTISFATRGQLVRSSSSYYTSIQFPNSHSVIFVWILTVWCWQSDNKFF